MLHACAFCPEIAATDENGKPYWRTHKCLEIHCRDASCGYIRGHPELKEAIKSQKKAVKAAAKLHREEKQALLAGMQPPSSVHVNGVLQSTMVNAGLDRLDDGITRHTTHSNHPRLCDCF